MDDLQWVITVPFNTGPRDVARYLAEQFTAHNIPTWDLTYEQAIDRLNMLNVKTAINAEADRIIRHHFDEYGR